VALLILPVAVAVWVARRMKIRRERIHQAETEFNDAETLAREQAIIDAMEADFHRP
jgi:Flp pilus assembly protein TadB